MISQNLEPDDRCRNPVNRLIQKIQLKNKKITTFPNKTYKNKNALICYSLLTPI